MGKKRKDNWNGISFFANFAQILAACAE